jgi:hypothetical protein
MPPTVDDAPAAAPNQPEPAAAQAVAAAQAEARRYATDVMTAFRKG